MRRSKPPWRAGAFRGRSGALDRHTINVRFMRIGDRITADQRFGQARDVQLESEVLAGFEGREGLPIVRLR
jgi:hypothetical protein